MRCLGRLVKEDFPEDRMTWWATLLKAIAEQERPDLALAAQAHLAVYGSEQLLILFPYPLKHLRFKYNVPINPILASM